MPADLAARTPAEVVQAVNQAAGKEAAALAARKLPSGDIILTFRDPATKQWFSANREKWLQGAFGPQAREATRTFAILVKGMHRRDLEGVTETEFQQELGFRSVDKVKIRLPAAKGYTRATVLVALADLAEATKACEEGLLWRAQLYDCEPYWATLDPTQCFKCWKWGHIQRYCRKEALCPHCGTRAHGQGGKEGEADCPTHRGLRPPQCPACGGKHSARDKVCPARAEAKAKAREAYTFRPRTFAQLGATGPNPQPQARIWALTTAASNETELYSPETTRPLKRPRGRPSGVAVAARSPSQLRIDLGFTGSSQTHSTVFKANQPTNQPVNQPADQPASQPPSQQGTPQPTQPNPHPSITLSSRFHLIHKPGARAALYVTKRYEVSQWDYGAEDLWCWVRLTQDLEVWSVYNPPATKEAPGQLLSLPIPNTPVVLAGDFNLHHPYWDLYNRLDREAEDLLNLAARWDLELRTPYGAATWAPQGRRQARPSTIDHIWASTGLKGSYCGIGTRGRSDHYPQVLEVSLSRPQESQASQPPGWSWGMMDKKRVKAEAKSLPLKMGLETGELARRASTPQGLEEAFNQLVAELQAIAEQTTPKRKPNRGFQAPWWSPEIRDLRRRAREAERAYKAGHSNFQNSQMEGNPPGGPG
ncbi:hypothetical protein VTJ04DRAFT_4092 [Mycothermus thermophilus]|uniref:uncharacterized protein n=1 Tax=Humicola insolens TaxID=85995 RepID=UPI0037433751